MGSRVPDAEQVYAAADRWVDSCLRHDDSLFTPGREVWSSNWLSELRTRFLDRPDERQGPTFMEKLQRQLGDAPPQVIQLMGEALYVYFLIVATKNSATELRRMEEVLSLSQESVEIPSELVDGLTPGLAGPGQAFHGRRPFQLAVIIEFAEQWKRLTSDDQELLLTNPYAFRDFLMALEPESRLLTEFPDRGSLQRHALLHLVHPDVFESIVSMEHKRLIVQAFSGLLDEPEEDLDRALAVIRAGLERGRESEWLSFYHEEFRGQWDPKLQTRRQRQAVTCASTGVPTREIHDERFDFVVESAKSFEALALELNLSVEDLRTLERLLEDKRQLVLQGPPGTGKTFVAQQLALHLAAAEHRVTLVQFHPSYAYEDFVQGYRPALAQGQPTFELSNGPLLLAAQAARAEPQAKHFLVIDELNRGNLAKVFGELYFLLEYRNREIRLQYSGDAGERFSLPENLYIIGTMNIADRSIALVDLALRRRFHFVEFHPDRPPIQGLLRRWLERRGLSRMSWVADVVDLANEQLSDDRHAAIGPSHFMKSDLDDEAVEMTWTHSVLPYLEERLFGNAERLVDFELDRLRVQAERGRAAESARPRSDETPAPPSDDAE